MPYQPVADIAVVSAMAYIIGKLKDEISVPFGVNVVKPDCNDRSRSCNRSKIRKKLFFRSIYGRIWSICLEQRRSDPSQKSARNRRYETSFKVNPEADAYLVQRDVQVVAKSIMFGDFADGLCVSSAAGAEPDDVILSRVHEVAKPRKVPVFCNTGCNHGNVREKLGNCDGVCMGTAFKKDGVFNGRVDKERVREFMEIVADIRKGL